MERGRFFMSRIRLNKPKDIRREVERRKVNQVNEDDNLTIGEKVKIITPLLNTSLRAMQQIEVIERLERIENYIQEQKGDGSSG
jgi:hypothetical protein